MEPRFKRGDVIVIKPEGGHETRATVTRYDRKTETYRVRTADGPVPVGFAQDYLELIAQPEREADWDEKARFAQAVADLQR